MLVESRYYQDMAFDQILANFNAGRKRGLLHMGMGLGKTHIYSRIMRYLRAKGEPSLMTVKGRSLVDQTSRRLESEGLPNGVRMAGHKNWKPEELVQIVSIDTADSRDLILPGKIIFLDEGHLATTKAYDDFLARHPDAYVLYVTGTPYNKGLKKRIEFIVRTISIKEATEQGYLVRGRYFGPDVPDLSGVHVTKGEYDNKEVDKIMNNKKLVGNIVDHWITHGENRPTLAFAGNVQHSLNIVEAFRQRGIRFKHLDAKSPLKERERAKQELLTGEIQGVSNISIFTLGIDIPWLSCIIDAAATLSYNRHLQKYGRGNRLWKGKDDFLVFDHAANTFRHGVLEDESEVTWGNDDKPVLPKQRGISLCRLCYAYFKAGKCPNGCVAETKVYEVENKGKLRELNPPTEEEKELKRLKIFAKEKNFKHPRGWVYHQMKARYGEEVATRLVPKRVVPAWVTAKKLDEQLREKNL